MIGAPDTGRQPSGAEAWMLSHSPPPPGRLFGLMTQGAQGGDSGPSI